MCFQGIGLEKYNGPHGAHGAHADFPGRPLKGILGKSPGPGPMGPWAPWAHGPMGPERIPFRGWAWKIGMGAHGIFPSQGLENRHGAHGIFQANSMKMPTPETKAFPPKPAKCTSLAVAGNAEKHLPTLTQLQSIPSFPQLRTSLQKRVRMQARSKGRRNMKWRGYNDLATSIVIGKGKKYKISPNVLRENVSMNQIR